MNKYLKVKKFINDYRLSGELNGSILVGISEDNISKLIDDDLLSLHEVVLLSKFYPSLYNRIEEIAKSISDEYVMCIRRDRTMELKLFLEGLKFNDLNYNGTGLSTKFIDNLLEGTVFKSRRHIEHDSSFIQIIPNMIVKHQNDIVLLHKIQKESRMYDTIGLPAGHIAVTDTVLSVKDAVSSYDILVYGIERELKEELGIDKDMIKSIKFIDYLNPVKDPINVSYYHLGITTEVILEDTAVIINAEPHKHNIIMYSELMKDNLTRRKLENWCIESLLQYLKKEEIENE